MQTLEEELKCSTPRSPAACPNPPGWPRPKSSGRSGSRRGAELAQAKLDATLLWIKTQEDAGLTVIGDGEQSRQHFVHGFLEQVSGIDFEHKVEMGIRNDRYKAMVPQVVGDARAEGPRARERSALPAREHDAQDQVHAARADDDRRHRGRPLLRRPREARDGLRRTAEPEALALQADGVDIVQFDEPAFNVYMDDAADLGRARARTCGAGARVHDGRAHLLRLRHPRQPRLEGDARRRSGASTRRCSRRLPPVRSTRSASSASTRTCRRS